MRQGKYTVVGTKYVHSSDLRKARYMHAVKSILCGAITLIVCWFAYVTLS
jgi:hypothetical protein